MQKIICLLVFVMLCSCATASVENTQQATAHYKLGVSYLNENNVQQAFVEFQKAYEFNPNDKDVLSAIGTIYLVKYEDFPKAADFFRRAVEIDKNFAEAYNNLGIAYERAGKLTEAIEAYNKAISNLLYRTPEYAYTNLGRVYYRQGKYDEAIDTYKESIKRVTEFYRAYYGIALCYNAKGKYGDAATAMTKAIELDPVYKGDRGKAIADLKQRKLKTKGEEEKDITDYIEILKY